MKMMTLRNMRENGVGSLAITCGAVWCHHQAVLDVNGFADLGFSGGRGDGTLEAMLLLVLLMVITGIAMAFFHKRYEHH